MHGAAIWPRLSPESASAPQSLINRRYEATRTFFRCGRYARVGHEWYVATREGAEIGPYADRVEAELALARHVAAVCFGSPRGCASLDDCGGREATALEELVREILGCWEQRKLRSENSAYAWVRQRLDAIRHQPAEVGLSELHTRVLENLIQELDAHTAGRPPAPFPPPPAARH